MILFGEDELVSLLKQQKLDKPLSIVIYRAATTLTGHPLYTEGFGACMALVIHAASDGSKKGGMAHLPGFGTTDKEKSKAQTYLKKVIDEMSKKMVLESSALVQIILLEGSGYRYVDLDFLTESYANCRVEDYRKANKRSAAVCLPFQASWWSARETP